MLNKWVEFLQKQPMPDGTVGMKNSTVYKYIQFLRVFLNWATRKGYNTKLDYQSFRPNLKQAVRRNLDSSPDDFMFRLSQNEANDLIARVVSQSVIPPGYNTGGADMFAFTEHGVAMRNFLMSNAQIFQRLDYSLLSFSKNTGPMRPEGVRGIPAR